MFFLLFTAVLTAPHEVQRIQNRVEKKMDIEIFGVSDITYLAIDPPPMSFFVTCIATAALPLSELGIIWKTVLNIL